VGNPADRGNTPPQLLRLADFEPLVPALPGVRRRIAHAVLVAQLRNWCPGLLLLQDPDDLLLYRDRFIFRSLSGPDSTSSGLIFRSARQAGPSS
jgi:hypothetical protein